MQGLIKKFTTESRYGFIETESGQDYFFHISEMKNKDTLPKEGDAVNFIPSENDRGPLALNIELVAPEDTCFSIPKEIVLLDNLVESRTGGILTGEPTHQVHATAGSLDEAREILKDKLMALNANTGLGYQHKCLKNPITWQISFQVTAWPAIRILNDASGLPRKHLQRTRMLKLPKQGWLSRAESFLMPLRKTKKAA